jgi:hypothetical protein
MLVRAETYEQRAEEAPTTRNAHTHCMQCRPRQKDALLQAYSLLAFFMLHACKSVPTAALCSSPGDLSVGSGRRGCFIGKAHQTFGFYSSGSSVSVVCRCWAASSMARCAARRPLSSRYQFSSHASSAIITVLHPTAHSRVGTADSSSLLSCWLARFESPCLLQGLFLWPSWPRESFSPVRETFPRPP